MISRTDAGDQPGHRGTFNKRTRVRIGFGWERGASVIFRLHILLRLSRNTPASTCVRAHVRTYRIRSVYMRTHGGWIHVLTPHVGSNAQVRTYVSTYVRTNAFDRQRIGTYVRTYVRTYVLRTYVRTYVRKFARTSVRMSGYVRTYVCTYVCAYVCAYVCMSDEVRTYM